MIRKFCTALIITALIIPMTTAPARANEDFNKFIAALTAFAILGIAAENATDHKVAKKPVYKPKKKHVHNNRKHKYLPKNCFKTFNTSRGKATYLKPKCVNQNKKVAMSLPKQCARTVWTDAGKRVLYSPACLTNHGYK